MKGIAWITLALASPAIGDVISASAHGFEVRETVQVPVAPAETFRVFGEVGRWWDPQHTYGGNAANLSLDLRPGGCFCERLRNGGGVEHMRVTYVDIDKHLVLTGALGPLLSQATTGVMDVQFQPKRGGTEVVLDYRAAGFFNGGADRLAPAVDGVLAQQARNFAAFAAKSR